MAVRLLLVDDNPLDRELVAWALGKIPSPPGPIETVCAGRWEDAAPLFAAGDIRLLILDGNLPGQSGSEILRSLPSSWRQRVIMVTGREDAEEAATMLREGIYRHVCKTLDWSETLRATVCEALADPRWASQALVRTPRI